jgi:uncharacterized protein
MKKLFATIAISLATLLCAAASFAEEAAPAPEPTAAPEAAHEDDQMSMEPGAINWIEIPSSNPEASQAFYSKLFDWKTSSEEGMFFYQTAGEIGGRFSSESKPAASNSGPVFYINCASVKAKLEEINAAGGKTLIEAMVLPQGWGVIGVFSDPEGNSVGLWSATE